MAVIITEVRQKNYSQSLTSMLKIAHLLQGNKSSPNQASDGKINIKDKQCLSQLRALNFWL